MYTEAEMRSAEQWLLWQAMLGLCLETPDHYIVSADCDYLWSLTINV